MALPEHLPQLSFRTSVLVFAGSAVLTVVFLAVAPASLGPTAQNDYEGYYRPVAEALLRGDGYVLNGQVNLHNPPGYPYILVALYALAELTGTVQLAWVTAFAVACTALSAVMAYAVGTRLFGERTGLVAAGLFATYPLMLVMASYRFSEVPYTLALLLVVYAALRAAADPARMLRWSLTAGLLCAAAALVRPAAIGLALPVGLALLLHRAGPPLRRRAAAATLVVVGFLRGVAPWEAWLHAKTNRIVALSEVGPEAAVAGVLVGARGAAAETGDPVFVPERVRAMSRRVAADRPGLRSTGDIARRLAQEPPGDVALLLAGKAVRAFYGTDSFKLEPLILLVQLPYLALMTAGLAVARRSPDPVTHWSPVLLALVLAYSWVVTMSALSIVRYLAPALAVLTLSAAPALVAGWDRVRPGVRRPDQAPSSV
jgi:4-amino-4-deoxy-L-arabinose transferase-like glycosyltransferase